MEKEKSMKKFGEWMELVRAGQENMIFIGKSEEKCRYIYRGNPQPIDALKLWVDKGKGMEEYAFYKGTNDQKAGNFSMVIKNSSKLILRDREDNLHPCGLKETKTDLKKIILYVKTGRLIMMVFASAEKNMVTVMEKIVDTAEDAATSCLFDNPSHPASNLNESGGAIDELFDCR